MCGGEIWSRPRRWAWPAETAWRWARWPWTATIRRLAGAGWWRITCGWGGGMPVGGRAGRDGVAVGAVAMDRNDPQACWCWLVADNLRLAGENAVAVGSQFL